MLLPLGERGGYVPYVLPLAGQVRGKRVYVERGCGTKAFQPSTARREGRK